MKSSTLKIFQEESKTKDEAEMWVGVDVVGFKQSRLMKHKCDTTCSEF